MTREQAADKLKKLKALAEKGVGGERESALKLYHKLMEKYQIDEGEILEERVTLHWFSYKTELEEELLIRVFYKVTGSPSYNVYTGNYSRRKKRGCNCTEIEAVEIKMLFDFYRQELKRELEGFLLAFYQGNNIFPDRTHVAMKNTTDRTGSWKGKSCGSIKRRHGTEWYWTKERRHGH